jgi:hypothetical protein
MLRLVCHPVPLGVKPLLGLMTRYLSTFEIYSITNITWLMGERICPLFEVSVRVSYTHLHIYTYVVYVRICIYRVKYSN